MATTLQDLYKSMLIGDGSMVSGYDPTSMVKAAANNPNKKLDFGAVSGNTSTPTSSAVRTAVTGLNNKTPTGAVTPGTTTPKISAEIIKGMQTPTMPNTKTYDPTQITQQFKDAETRKMYNVTGTQSGMAALNERFKGNITERGKGNYAVGGVAPGVGGSGIVTTVDPNSKFYQTLDTLTQMGLELKIPNIEGLLSQIEPGDNAALGRIQAGMMDYATKIDATGKTAARLQGAFDMINQSNINYQSQLDESLKNADKGSVQLQNIWKMNIDKADEYVANANNRMADVMAKIEAIHADTMKAMGDFSVKIDPFKWDPPKVEESSNLAKMSAHAMQASVQATMGAFDSVKQEIAGRYGADSPEMRELNAKYNASLTGIQSTIQVEFAKLQETSRMQKEQLAYMESIEANKNFNSYSQHAQDISLAAQTALLQARTNVATSGEASMIKAMTDMSMYINYHEQMAMQTRAQYATATAEDNLKRTQLDLQVAQLKNLGYTDTANWLASMPEYTIELGGLMEIIVNSLPQNDAMQQSINGGNRGYVPSGNAYQPAPATTFPQLNTQAGVKTPTPAVKTPTSNPNQVRQDGTTRLQVNQAKKTQQTAAKTLNNTGMSSSQVFNNNNLLSSKLYG